LKYVRCHCEESAMVVPFEPAVVKKSALSEGYWQSGR
jgi:hypothetical protein